MLVRDGRRLKGIDKNLREKYIDLSVMNHLETMKGEKIPIWNLYITNRYYLLYI
jgi:hypothetical protein